MKRLQTTLYQSGLRLQGLSAQSVDKGRLISIEEIANFVMLAYISGTWSWVKPLSVPESPPIGLYETPVVRGLSVFTPVCTAFAIFK